MTLPQAEESLKRIFCDKYDDGDWRPALKIVTEKEPDEDIHPLIKTLQEKSHNKDHPFVPTEYTQVAAEVTSMIGELQRRNQIFDGVPDTDAYIEPAVEREVEVVPIRMEDELVAEVLREQAIEKGDIIEVEDDESEG
jgi:hypothetical protein